MSDWIAADWGTTNLRLWLMSGLDAMEERSSPRGMSALSGPADFQAALAGATQGWPLVPVIACGMIGARQGWVEVPYVSAPCNALPLLTAIAGQPDGRAVLIASGVMQAQPADVMRGEETQVAGLLQASPGFDGVVCLPGSHTKWIRVSAGEICHFQTVMTGEVFGLLAHGSVLRHSIGQGLADPCSAAFTDAVAAAISQPLQAWARLFGLRAQALIGSDDNESASRLAGTLIGMDLGASRSYWLGQKVVILCAPKLAALFQSALQSQGANGIIGDVDEVTRAGLFAAWQRYDAPHPRPNGALS